ncbi:NAD-dependent epimerase/dehydratase family protein [Rhodococcus sp. Eu-32]|uniref:NAD-dependent epimerase/dehydratase family protein n=1 Tax=Rhodococcus sp. Eu-32 TaxID=1017319 RepID=UPI000DF3903B|nr:NAD-dependent epimerase/dehydratase family protein [Rhodococcus sp. Eu-32]RRQ26591.1 NAD-dependent epimerase/dehydratase family protein [Rhodococcus sp. Eu-32]
MNDASQLTVLVTGATGNLGTSVVDALTRNPRVGRIIGLARRAPTLQPDRTTFVEADIAKDDLLPFFSNVDVVVHLAWQFQPTRDPAHTWSANVLGALAVFDAAARAHVPSLIYSSSVGAYAPGPKDTAVKEDWPTHGWPGAAYTREKSYLERALDAFELQHPSMRIVRIRPAFVFKPEASTEQRRLFAGPFLPPQLVRPELIPFVPKLPGLVFQAVHSADVGDAFSRAATNHAHGAFNIAAEPPVTAAVLADVLGARVVPVPVMPVRALVTLLWKLRIVPTSPDLLDAVLRLPLMDTSRARTELGWQPRHTSAEALSEFVRGVHEVRDAPTPPLSE